MCGKLENFRLIDVERGDCRIYVGNGDAGNQANFYSRAVGMFFGGGTW